MLKLRRKEVNRALQGLTYDNSGYAISRLEDTVVSLRGSDRPILIDGAFGEGNKFEYVSARDLIDGKSRDFKVEEVNFVPKPLGFLNIPTPLGAVYLQRVPRRDDWRQGLRGRNMLGCGDDPWSVVNRFPESLQQCWQDSYPDLDKCLHVIRDKEIKAAAFGRDFAVGRIGSNQISVDQNRRVKNDENLLPLWHKRRCVGTFDTKSESLDLDIEFGYLKEKMESCLSN